MKVIDLLNKIANGEELPKKIKVYSEWYKEDVIYFLSNTNFSWQDYYMLENDNTDPTLFENNSIGLNDEVEIIEEDKKIEKLEHWVDVKSWVKGNDLEKGLEEQSEFNKNIYYKINEIIDYLEKENK